MSPSLSLSWGMYDGCLWMDAKLLNSDKTEVVLFDIRQQLEKFSNITTFEIEIGCEVI